MRISAFSLRTLSTPLHHPFSTALRTTSTIEEICITLTTDNNLTGLGSAPDTQAITGDSLERIYTDLLQVRSMWIGYELKDYERTFAFLATLPLCKSAQAALDIALHDLFAKQAAMPLYAFLGGKPRLLHTLYTISVDTPQSMVAQAKRAYEKGFHELKIKLDRQLDVNVERIHTIAQALPRAKLYLDPNQALSYPDAKSLIESLAHYAIILVEQPTAAQDKESLRRLTALRATPILADESVFSLSDATTLIATQGCDAINLKLMKFGGIYPTREIINAATSAHMPCMMGSMLETSISVTAALHVAFAYENIRYIDLDGPTLAKHNPFNGGIHYEGSRVILSDEIGLGFDF